jgi:hypothetical protein
MPNPNSITNGQGREIDPLPNAAGTVKLKLAIGTQAVAGATDDAAWQGVATHEAGATVAAADGIVLVATGAVGDPALPVSTDNPMPISDAGGSITVDGTVAVTVAALPLPSGAATSALQGGGLPAALGSTDAAHSLPVVLSSDGPGATALATLHTDAQSELTATQAITAALANVQVTADLTVQVRSLVQMLAMAFRPGTSALRVTQENSGGAIDTGPTSQVANLGKAQDSVSPSTATTWPLIRDVLTNPTMETAWSHAIRGRIS